MINSHNVRTTPEGLLEVRGKRPGGIVTLRSKPGDTPVENCIEIRERLFGSEAVVSITKPGKLLNSIESSRVAASLAEIREAYRELNLFRPRETETLPLRVARKFGWTAPKVEDRN